MSQHDYDLANQAGAGFRSDANSVLAAIATVNEGPTAPNPSFARMFWADSSSGLLKQRNAANTVWLVRATLAETFALSRASDTILGVGDFRRTFIATAAFTQTLTAAATLGDGWEVNYRNDSTGNLVLDPNGSELIDGATTITLHPGQSCKIVCNGSAFKTIGRTRQIVKRKSADESVSSSTTLQDDDDLFFPIAANEEWVADFDVLFGDQVADSTGLKVAVNAPSGATIQVVATGHGDAGASDMGFTTTIDAALPVVVSTGDNTVMTRVQLWVLNGATPGTVQFRWGPTISIGTALTAKKGGKLIAHQIA